MKEQINEKLAKRLTLKQKDVLKKYLKEKREVPIRFVYLGEYWDKIAKDQKYELSYREVTALKNSIGKLAKTLGTKKINIIHLGPGNGMEIPYIIKAINPSNIKSYNLVDINPTMLQLSKEKISKDFPEVKVKSFLKDIETYGIKDVCEKTKKEGAKINVIILIANGVLFSNEDLVKEIKTSMDKEDYFYLTLELYEENKDKEIIKPYLIPTVLDLLSNGLKILNYNPKYEDFYGEIDKKEGILKIYFAQNKDKTKKLLVLHSYKTTLAKLKDKMKKLFFKEIFCEEYKLIHSCGGLFKT